jgi:hypothetical protein
MKSITWIQPYYDLVLNKIPIGCKTVLDVGAGYGIFGFIIKQSRKCTIDAVEPFDYLNKHYDHVFKLEWKDFHNGYVGSDTSKYDVLVSTEMIEHLPHEKHHSVMSIRDFEINNYKVQLLGTFNVKGISCRVSFHPKLYPILKHFVKTTNIIAWWKR